MRLVAFVLVLVSHTAFCHFRANPSYDIGTMDRSEYSNTWALKIVGGRAVADSIAEKYGFINEGQSVSHTGRE